MNHHAIIKALGGPHAVGAALRDRGVIVADVTVRSWLLDGRSIPAKYWTHIAALGEAAGVEVSFEQLAAVAAAPIPPGAGRQANAA